jgi:HPt (histidine-containing phosphotransfer) domain-containing protein
MNRDLKTNIPDDLRPLIKGFLGRRAQEIQELELHLLAGDWIAVALIGHRLKGNGAAYGFRAITEIGAELESAANAAEALRARQLVNELKDVVTHFNEQLN